MQSRSDGLLGEASKIYLLFTVALALGFLVVSLAKGADLMGAPYWAWGFWCVSLLGAVNITYWSGAREYTWSFIRLGFLPLLMFALAGALDTPGDDGAFTREIVRDLYEVVWFVALVLSPGFLLVGACAGFIERSRSSSPLSDAD